MTVGTETSTRILVGTVLVGALLVVAGLGLLGWLRQGPEMFLALMANGLSTCF